MRKTFAFAVLAIFLTVYILPGCDACDRRDGAGTAPKVSPESLVGVAPGAGTDSSSIESGADAYLAVGYVSGGAKPKSAIAFFKLSGGKYVKETEIAIEGAGVPVFSAEKASNLAGIRNMNNFGGPEIISRTNGDCGEGSSYLTIISRDGKDRWSRIFSGCEGMQKDSRTSVESEMATDGNEVIKLKSFDLENGESILRKTEAVVWDKEAWHVYKTRNLMVPGSPITVQPRKK